MPDEAPAVALDDEAKRLQLEKIKAEARSAIAQADRKRFDATLPAVSGKPLDGTVTTDDKTGVLADLLAYGVLAEIATAIVGSLAIEPGAAVLLTDTRDLVADQGVLSEVDRQLVRHTTRLSDAADNLDAITPAQPDGLAAAGALLAVPALVSLATGLSGLLQTNYVVKGRETSVGRTAVLAAMASALTGRQVAIDGFGRVPRGDGTVLGRLVAVSDQLDAVSGRAMALRETLLAPAEAELTELTAELAAYQAERRKLVVAGAVTAAIDAEITRLAGARTTKLTQIAPVRAVLRNTQEALDGCATFVQAATTAPAADRPPIIRAALREAWSDTGWIVYAEVTSAGGETITRQSALRRPRYATFVGGCRVDYLALDPGGAVHGGSRTWTGRAQLDLKLATLRPSGTAELPSGATTAVARQAKG
ncbi:hypothetical protein [Microlunatus ginsengisoli]|uniref:Uncharacterized protein n=1 Tax=Microlunatus ginsengisoli TaxID=363863 RepID=A0ABP6ZNF4_9ACTN